MLLPFSVYIKTRASTRIHLRELISDSKTWFKVLVTVASEEGIFKINLEQNMFWESHKNIFSHYVFLILLGETEIQGHTKS